MGVAQCINLDVELFGKCVDDASAKPNFWLGIATHYDRLARNFSAATTLVGVVNVIKT